jgi:hypothetical protein
LFFSIQEVPKLSSSGETIFLSFSGSGVYYECFNVTSKMAEMPQANPHTPLMLNSEPLTLNPKPSTPNPKAETPSRKP